MSLAEPQQFINSRLILFSVLAFSYFSLYHSVFQYLISVSFSRESTFVDAILFNKSCPYVIVQYDGVPKTAFFAQYKHDSGSSLSDVPENIAIFFNPLFVSEFFLKNKNVAGFPLLKCSSSCSKKSLFYFSGALFWLLIFFAFGSTFHCSHKLLFSNVFFRLGSQLRFGCFFAVLSSGLEEGSSRYSAFFFCSPVHFLVFCSDSIAPSFSKLSIVALGTLLALSSNGWSSGLKVFSLSVFSTISGNSRIASFWSELAQLILYSFFMLFFVLRDAEA